MYTQQTQNIITYFGAILPGADRGKKFDVTEPCVGALEDPEVEANIAEGLDNELVEEVVADVSKELAEIRREHDQYDAMDWFYTRVLYGERGGPWCSIADSMNSMARGGPATEFCTRYKFMGEMTFTFATYGEASCATLAHEVARLGNYFCQLWVESYDMNTFTFDHLTLVVPDDDNFLDWLREQPVGGVNWARGQQVRALRPQNP